ncbi:nuclear pore complex protein Nup50 isoform X1 [Podarcis raffonei]|uniref:nuclear pore complex protein Nup50 isoform X1 n=1 Tax=Podarcis raffonei TaxID=65483 RepID=UPI0023298379|nr:nuclear pore complex protein Nup50 isoform X1 [Podarcis raffonei]XP_053243574.1 nuclear pore complex protein Nup50 isoform X1 [Podarcis raffonei]XP_053243575.1 nuclear pore complex protein Nup50 isoform X1 [Podarcis raffonei]XP_053243576.1 nuclear pore complex protein Nup50 isoform X1 [Podarcis raffonei]XP_053243577.1 nuclear pore complex protein Nup50 isoform X1 [Podarcis raffonei]XP_053243578.1 nuclear pore complex protein Nup50 isoform X1 [Podarcis raffonei]
MAKRVAEKELTDRNWDQEEETEEVRKVGTFSVASEEVLKNRAIKKAKRRNVGFEAESGGAFKGFKGFVLPSGGGGFSGFGNGTGTKPLGGLSNGGGSIANSSSFTNLKTAAETTTTFSSVVSSGSVNNTVTEKKPVSVEANGESQQPLSSGFTENKACSPDAYHKQLAALNCSVRDWIVKHVNANPLCDLSPIFRDYEKYLAEIEQRGMNSDSGSESDSNKTVGTQPGSAFGSPNLQQSSTFFFNNNKSENAPGKKTEMEKKTEPKLGSMSTVSFTFSKSVDNSGLNSGALPSFSFSPGSASLFGKDTSQGKVVSSFSSKALDIQTESGGSEDKGGDEEDEEPPKAVVNEIKEDDAFYSKKCKVFYKKDNEFKEKGIGTLHLKHAGNQKIQLLVRADTNLGNILLNILVPPKMPCSRTGKNNVLIVCVPNPPIDEKNATVPVPILIRVKTSQDADELHKILLEKKEV